MDETDDWRRICDPDGGLAWVSRSMVDGRRTVMAPAGPPVTMLSQPKDGAAPAAYLRPRAIAVLGGARDGWRRITSPAAPRGWVKASARSGAWRPACNVR